MLSVLASQHGPLPPTGSDIQVWWLMVAILLIGGGTALVIATRRRD